MSGVMMILAAGTQPTFSQVVGSASAYVDPVSIYADGFIASGSILELYYGLAIGSLTPSIFQAVNCVGLYWHSFDGHGGTGQAVIEFTGNRTAGFVNNVTLAGTSLGTIGAPAYDAYAGTTVFQLGANGRSNPFGTSGTKAITIS